MNYSTAVMLINENIRAVLVTYEPDDTEYNPAKRTMYKTLDDTISVNDLVIVPSSTRHKFTIAKVVEVDAEVDFESGVQVDWVAGKSPTEDYQDILKKEKEMVAVIRASEKRAKREEMRKNMIGLQEEGELSGLAIANMGAEPAIENNTE